MPTSTLSSNQQIIVQHLARGAKLVRAPAEPWDVGPSRQHALGIVLFAPDGRQLRPVDDRTILALVRRGRIKAIANENEVVYVLTEAVAA